MVKNLVSAIVGKKPKAPKVVVPPQPEPTPMPDEDAIQKAAMQAELRRKQTGRSSTNLVEDEEDKL